MRVGIVAAVVSGLLLRLPYPPIEWWWVAWVAMAPFLWALNERSRKEAAWIGWIFGFAFYYPNLMWLNTLSSVNPLAPVGIVFLGAACGAYGALFGLGASVFLRRVPRLAVVLVPAWWAALEYVRLLGEMGFPWVYLGHSQAEVAPLIQICAFTGVYGLSFAIVLSGLTVARVATCLRMRRTFSLAIEAATVCGVVLGGIWAVGLLSMGFDSDSDQSLRVALIQPGVPQDLKLASYASPDRAERTRLQEKMVRDLDTQLDRAAKEAPERPDLYVLPESGITDPFFNLRREQVALVEGWARRADVPIFLGANRFAPPPGLSPSSPDFFARSDMFNSAWLVRPDTGLDPVAYDKMHLVPFGEYGSWFEIIPGFTEYILGIGSFTPGTTARVFEVANTKFASLICFESCFPYLVRQYAKSDAADWLCVITNDAWYKTSSGARRHQIQSIFRAVESRMPVVRVANTGISCVIDAWGRTLDSTPLQEGQPVTRFVEVPLDRSAASSRPTVYMRPWGEWFSWLSLSACIAAFLLIWLRMKRADDVSDHA